MLTVNPFSLPLTLPLSPAACLRVAASAKAGEREGVKGAWMTKTSSQETSGEKAVRFYEMRRRFYGNEAGP
jgi:hypothetical protein